MEKIKTLIIGSGPAGYTAAIYAGRANLQPVLYSGMQPGGQLTITTEVENFPGYPNGVDGTQMMMDMKEQAARFGAEMRDGSIVKADFSSRPFHLTDERDNEIEAETVIIATGASAKYLGLADEEKYRGQGVSACATCDGFFYRKRTVAVVGGGDTACEEAMYLSGLAKKVYMIVRKPYLRASEIMQQRVKNKENIEILFETNTLGLFGENGVEGAHLVRHKGEANEEKFDISIDGFFLAIGHKPNTDLLFVAVRIYEPFSKACEMLGELIFSLVSAGRIGTILHYPEQTGTADYPLEQFDITFDHVSFGYNEDDVIHDVSFTARQGEITALVGPSGCGKSTLCKLAARFWDVERGSVRIGGVNVNEIDPETLLRNVSIVFQDVVLFNDTIYNNIKIGKENATQEEIIAAAKLAQCDEFIRRLPQGYNTVIGENGKTLSGGERQRLSIARAFLKDAPIILLDESTASIDPENETKIQQAIGTLIQNKTVLIIAHKLRSIVECDQIVVLKEGQLEEKGTHDELMSHEGLYHTLYSLQNESLNWTVKS